MKRRIRLMLEYEGTAYVGWQTQKNGVSIQETLEAQLFKVTGERISLHGSGRTDSGVHARAQVAHFDTFARMPADKFPFALNTGLPQDIRVLYADDAPEDFHARFGAIRKHYRYRIQLGPHARVFSRTDTLHIHGVPDVGLMRSAAALALGEHDFHAFMAAGSSLENTVRRLYRSEWTVQGDLLFYDVEGNGFLYNMVRILVGTMLDIGKGTIPPDSMGRALQSGKRQDAGATAPAKGLTLMRVVYPGFDTASIAKQEDDSERRG